ncbi:hypothetical protein DFH06DRAFT_655378 [Mycena polygramma]|nr:hypothetical protein DFH06DRAFT_655378 [Mycena polygramma]
MMPSNVDRPMHEAHALLPRGALWGSCTPRQAATQQTSRVSGVHPAMPIPSGFKYERAPYACVPHPSMFAPNEPDVFPRRAFNTNVNAIKSPTQLRGPRLKPIALPPQISGVTAVTLNPVLRLGARFNGARIDVDFASDTRMEPAVSMELAVFPGLPSLTLFSPRLPWAITVHASGRFVTVGDLLQAIHQSLDMRVTEDQAVSMGWRIGYTETTGDILARGVKRKQGYKDEMKRLDLLGGRTKFVGLSESTMGCEAWVVNFV